METCIGRIEEVLPSPNQTIPQLMREILIDANYTTDEIEEDTMGLFAELSHYLYFKDKIFYIENKYMPEEGYIDTQIIEENKILYNVNYYNGGASLQEVLVEVLKKYY